MFTVPLAHSDYPPFLPLLNGLCWRLMQMQPSVIPFGWSMFSLLLIASVLFLELYPRNRVIAIASLFFLTTQDHFIRIGTGQLADNWIALFLLLACISYHSFRQNRDPASAFWCGAMLGATLWTKNEGMILTAILLLFFIGDLIRYGGIRSFLAGIIIPLAALIWFKSALAPANDIVAAQSQWPWDKITDLSRYDDIRRQTWDMILLFFPAMPYLLTGYFVFCIFQKKKADPEIWALLLCAAAYLLVYLITPHNLGWHINTSADRLIFQLMPALLWIISRRICSVEFSLRATP